MNVYATVALAGLVGEFAVARAADVLNVRALTAEPPRDVRRAYDPIRLHRAREYTRARTRFDGITATVHLSSVLGFWWAGGFGWLDARLRALGLASVPTGLLFVGILGLAGALVALPFHWWSTFVVEERFGFNTTTRRTFWADVVKGLLLAAILGAPLLATILWLFQATTWAWLWCWLATTAFTVAVQFVAPTWIMPLFNRFAPLPEGQLREAILAYSRSVAFPLEDVFVIDGSRRSTKANALFTGFGRHRRVALFDTLLEKLDPGEVVAVVAHEVGHYKRRHVVKGMLLGIAQMGGLFALVSVLIRQQGLFAAFGVAEPSVHAGLVLAALLLGAVELPLALALHAWSRRNEREADAFAARTTGAGRRLARALERLSIDSLANPTPHPLYVALHYSHPPLRERLRALAAAG